MQDQVLTAEDTRLVGNARDMIREAEHYYETRLKDKYDERERYNEGNHWEGINRTALQATLTTNFCRKIVYWYVSLLTDTPARLQVTGRSPDDYKNIDPNSNMTLVDAANKAMKYIWDTLDMDNRDAVAWQYALVDGLAWYKVFINMEKRWLVPGGDPQNPQHWVQGELDVAVLSPRHVLIDPRAAWSANIVEARDKAEYMIHRNVVPIRRLVRRYPHLSEQIHSAIASAKDLEPWAYEDMQARDGSSGRQTSEFMPTSSRPGEARTGGMHIYTGYKPEHRYEGKVAVVKEVWMRDDDYEGGKVCVTTVNDLLLEKRPDPEHGVQYPYDHGEFPFIPKVCNPVAGRVEGYGALDIVLPLQDAYNQRDSQIMNILNLYLGPPILSEENSIDKNYVFAPMVNVQYMRGAQKPEWWNPPPLPPAAFESLPMIKDLIHELAGLEESITTPAVKAGAPNAAMETAIEQAMQRIRNNIRWNVASDKALGRQILSVTQQLYGESGMIARITGAQGGAGNLLLTKDDIGAMRDFEITRGIVIKIKEAERFKKLLDMANQSPVEERGIAIPDDEIIDASGDPNPEALKEKVRQTKNLQMQLQQLMQENEELKAQMDQGGMMPPEGAPPPGPGGM